MRSHSLTVHFVFTKMSRRSSNDNFRCFRPVYKNEMPTVVDIHEFLGPRRVQSVNLSESPIRAQPLLGVRNRLQELIDLLVFILLVGYDL